MRSHDGCWTCKVRKKRCDELRPVCRNCSALEITCHSGDKKPSWMDNGIGQKEKAEEIKREVKNAAARRRGNPLTDALEPITSEHNQDAALPSSAITNPQDIPITCPPVSGGITLDTSTDWPSSQRPSNIDATSSDTNQESWSRPNWLTERNSYNEGRTGSELDRRFMMLYFEQFFPFLFPFYRPPLLEGGRSWIMELVAGSEAMWHSTLCLSTYFLSVSLDGATSDKTLCKSLAWEKLLKHLNVSFMMLQRSLQEVTSTNTQGLIVEMAKIMGSIIQLQRFETSVGNFQNCQQHRDAAITLFEEVFRVAENLGEGRSLPTFDKLLQHLGRPLWTGRSSLNGAWSTDQAAFRFYSALLVVDDIISSTCTAEPPRLSRFHAQILCANEHSLEGKPALKLENFIGCETWVLLQISEIAALDAWKKSVKKVGQLDMMELVARASVIKQYLLGHLSRLESVAHTPKVNPLECFAPYNDQLPHMPGGCATFVTGVWAHAALLYLSITVSGWQPASTGVRENVIKILVFLEQMPDYKLLRTMIWPFCLAGCLAQSDEECRFRGIANALAPQQLFGTARKALEIMENAWNCRNEISADTDFAVYVSSLGYVPLLV